MATFAKSPRRARKSSCGSRANGVGDQGISVEAWDECVRWHGPTSACNHPINLTSTVITGDQILEDKDDLGLMASASRSPRFRLDEALALWRSEHWQLDCKDELTLHQGMYL